MKKQFFTLLALCIVAIGAWAEAGPICKGLLGKETEKSGQYVPAHVKWETDADGNVNITIFPYANGEETASMPTRWRGRGMADDVTNAKGWGLKMDGVAKEISDYFAKNYTANGTQSKAPTVYQLAVKAEKKAELDAADEVIITFSASSPSSICWWTPRGNNAYAKYAFEYLYGSQCASLTVATPTNVAISGNTITFDAVTNATGYLATIYLDGKAVKTQAVVPAGTELVAPMLTGQNYTVKVKATGDGGVVSDESSEATWNTIDNPQVAGASQYCSAIIGTGSDAALMTWETSAEGNIVITISGASNPTWRAEGFGNDLSAFKVGSVDASNFFTKQYTNGATVYTLVKKAGVNLVEGETITYVGSIRWKNDNNGNAYLLNQTLTYTYGAVCGGLSKPENVAVDADNHITFDAVTGAEAYEATVMFGTTTVLTQTVVSGDELNFKAYADGDYQVTLIAKAEGMSNSEPSEPVSIHRTAPAFTAEASEICIHALKNVDNGDETHNVAYLSATTDAEGRIVFSIKGDEGCAFRGATPLKLDQFMIGVTPANRFFTATKEDDNYVFTPIAGSGIGYGAVLKYHNSIAWQITAFTNCYVEGYDLSFTYGNTTCEDLAPELVAQATALNKTDIHLTMTATDDHGLAVQYTIQREGVEDIILSGNSGEEMTYDVVGLTSDVEYTFTITATEGFNVSAPHVVSATPVGDDEAPATPVITLKPVSTSEVLLSVVATDNYPANITYTLVGTGVESPIVAAPGVNQTQRISGLTAGETYTYTAVATDAAGNVSETGSATVTLFTENIALNKSATAGASQYGPSRAVDGLTDGNNRWGSNVGTATHPDDDWWMVDLGSRYTVEHIRMMWNNARPTSYKLLYSNDKISWTAIDYATTPEKDKWVDYMLAAPIVARYWKVQSLANYNAYGISIVEFEAFGTIIVDTEAPQNLSLSGEALSEDAIRLHLSATDNWYGNLSYTLYQDGVAMSEPIVKEQGIAFDYDVVNLQAGQSHDYYFEVSDGLNEATSATITVATMAAGNNVALLRPASSGSSEGGHTADKAFDGNPATYWGNYGKAAYDDHNNWLAVNLCGQYDVERVTIRWEHFPDYAGFVLQARSNGGEWKTVFTYTGANYNQGQTQIIDFAEPVKAEELRIFSEGATNTWYMAIYEVKVMGEGNVELIDSRDNSDRIEGLDGQTVDLSLNRSFPVGTGWFTLVLPFDLDEEQVAASLGECELAEMVGAELRGSLFHLDFAKKTTVRAGVPFLYLPAETVEAPLFKGVTIKKELHNLSFDGGHVQMIGLYGPTALFGAQHHHFLAADNYLYEATLLNPEGTPIKGFRDYFVFAESLPAGVLARVRFVAETATGLEPVDATGRVEKIVENGRVVILKDGAMYNVCGIKLK